jgi:GTP cyclohydrolase I
MALHQLPDDIDPKATQAGGPDNMRLEELVHELLGQIGEDPQRDGLVSTPRRVATAWRDLTSGYDMSVDELLNDALFDVAYDEMVIVKDIEIFSLCEHHLLPFFGKMHIAYIPRNKVIGLSKVARVADMFARRLQVQERLTHQVAETIQKAVDLISSGGKTLNRYDISYQALLSSRIFARNYHTLANLWMLSQSEFNFAQLNAETANLDLMIATSQKLDVPVSKVTPHVAGLV